MRLKRWNRWASLGAVAACCGAVIAQASAQAPAPAPPAPPAPPAQTAPGAQPSPATPPAPATPTTPPATLDEALGLGSDASKSDAEQARREALQRSLNDAQPRDLLAAAIEEMKRSAALLQEREAGLPTQRVQEAVVSKLDDLIAAAQRVRQNQQQSGQSSSQQQSQGKQGKQQGKDGQQSQASQEPREGKQERGGRDRRQPQAGERPGGQGDANATEPPAAVDPTRETAQFDESRAEWGRLPARVRDAVRQGMRDPMSAAYRRLTQDYYRRMAEEPKR